MQTFSIVLTVLTQVIPIRLRVLPQCKCARQRSKQHPIKRARLAQQTCIFVQRKRVNRSVMLYVSNFLCGSLHQASTQAARHKQTCSSFFLLLLLLLNGFLFKWFRIYFRQFSIRVYHRGRSTNRVHPF